MALQNNNAKVKYRNINGVSTPLSSNNSANAHSFYSSKLIGNITGPLRLVPSVNGKSKYAIRFSPFRSAVAFSLITALSLLSVLIINTKLDQDAFALAHLKAERNSYIDQSSAVMEKVNFRSSPLYISVKAKKLGMVPSGNIKFIDLKSEVKIVSKTSQGK